MAFSSAWRLLISITTSAPCLSLARMSMCPLAKGDSCCTGTRPGSIKCKSFINRFDRSCSVPKSCIFLSSCKSNE